MSSYASDVVTPASTQVATATLRTVLIRPLRRLPASRRGHLIFVLSMIQDQRDLMPATSGRRRDGHHRHGHLRVTEF